MTTEETKIKRDDEEEDDEDEEEEEIEEDEEEDEEPKLKYQRLGADVLDILKGDAASCMAVHDKFLALSTHWGVIYILDFNGNEIRRFTSHATTINELSIDASGEYIASCSDDGKVCINGLYTGESFEYEHNRPVLSVALDPDYAKKNSKAFIIGGRSGQLTLSTKGWFGRKETVIHQGEGPINAIKWRGSLVAWANDKGVKIYDNEIGQRITYIDRPKNSPRADLFRCHLCWENDHTLLIGWANCIKIGKITERNDNPNGLPVRCVELVAFFHTEYMISGIAPFGDDWLVVLAYTELGTVYEPSGATTNSNSSLVTKAERPEFRIITRANHDITSDALTIHGYENYKANDYRLGYMNAESLFYVVSPHDIVVAKPRDLDDHVSWLMERKRYEEALRAAEANEYQLREHKLPEIGEKYIEHLLNSREVEAAAELCPKILKRDPSRWEKWIYKFGENSQLRAICDYIPVGNPTLSPAIYEMILGFFLNSNDESDHRKFLSLVLEWNPSLYNVKNVITALIRKIRDSSDESLMDALAKLYAYDKQYDKTLDIYLRLHRGAAFQLIEEKDLFDSIRDKVLLLMHYDEEKAIQLLVSNTNRIPIDQVVQQLQKHPKLLHLYLHQLFNKDAHLGKDFHEQQITLYADYDYKGLLTFLQQSNYYPLEKAYKVCEERKFYPEMVYIQGRMGNTKKGLKLLIDHIGDVVQAIEFIKSQNDQELWEDLIDYSMTNPRFVSGLLEHIGAYVDPLRLVKRIPLGMNIDKLRDRLVKIISDYNLQMSLREGCKEILKADCVDLLQRLYKGQRRGRKVSEDLRCAICSGQIVDMRPSGGVIVFFCQHAYHQRCLRSGAAASTAANTNSSNASAPANGSMNSSIDLAQGEKLWCTICQSQSVKQKSSKGANARRLGGASNPTPQ